MQGLNDQETLVIQDNPEKEMHISFRLKTFMDQRHIRVDVSLFIPCLLIPVVFPFLYSNPFLLPSFCPVILLSLHACHSPVSLKLDARSLARCQARYGK